MSRQFDSQHVEAMQNSMRSLNSVSCDIFDDKVRSMGHLVVENGKITVTLHDLPSMTTEYLTSEFVADEIRMAIVECWKRKPDAFNPWKVS